MTEWPTPEALPPPDWPTPGGNYDKVAELLKALYQARLDELANKAKAFVDADAAALKVQTDAQAVALKVQTDAVVAQEAEDWQLQKADFDAEVALYKSIHDARIEVVKGAIDRGQAGAEFIRNAAAAIVTLYTGLLGFVFGTDVSKGQTAFPTSGVIPALFLGVALAGAAFYVAFLTRAPSVDRPKPSSSTRVMAERRLNVFTDWVSQTALDRVYWLHVAVVAFAFGVLFLPVPFTSLAEGNAWGLALVAAALTFLIPLVAAPPTDPAPD